MHMCRFRHDLLLRKSGPCNSVKQLFDHSENMLLAMIADTRPHIRQFNSNHKGNITCVCNKFRRFQVPLLDASEYHDMVDGQNLTQYVSSSFASPVTQGVEKCHVQGETPHHRFIRARDAFRQHINVTIIVKLSMHA